MWSGLKWLRTGSSGGLLWQWEWSDCSGNNSGKLTETNTERGGGTLVILLTPYLTTKIIFFWVITQHMVKIKS